MLAQALRQWYGIEIDSVVQMKSVYGLVARGGQRYVWKPAGPRDDERRLRHLSRALTAAESAGIAVAGPLPNRQGEWLTWLPGGEAGYLQPWLPGRHLDVRVPDERRAAIQTLAKLHTSTQQLSAAEFAGLQAGDLATRLSMKAAALRATWPHARQWIPQLRAMEAEVLRHLQAALDVYAAWRQCRRAGGVAWPCSMAFCHRDVAPHNLLWQAEEQGVALIDFDHAGTDDPLADIVQFSGHTVFLARLSPGHFSQVVDTYAQAAGLRPEQEDVLWQLLRFPDSLIRALTDWVKAGQSPDATGKVIHAVRLAQEHFAVWTHDYQMRYGMTGPRSLA